MAAMKEFPDKFFDLAVVDPPYGSGMADNGGCNGWFSKYRSQSVNVEREREPHKWNRFGERFDRYKHSSEELCQPGGHGKQKYHLGTPPAEELPETRRNMGLCELAGRGQRSTQKNYFVGCCAGTGLF